MRLEVESDAALVAVRPEEGRPHQVVARRLDLPHEIAPGILDLDDIRPQVAQHLRGKGAENDGGEVDDPDAVKDGGFFAQWSCVGHTCSGARPELGADGFALPIQRRTGAEPDVVSGAPDRRCREVDVPRRRLDGGPVELRMAERAATSFTAP